MSLLYKALLKNSQNNQGSNDSSAEFDSARLSNKNSHQGAQVHSALLTSTQVPVTPAVNRFSTSGAIPSNKHIPLVMWLVVGFLLLTLGLLAGYIYGNTQSVAGTTNITSTPTNAAPLHSASVSSVIDSTEIDSSVTDSSEIDSSSMGRSKSKPTEADSGVTSENDDKKIEIALDAQGKVTSKVTSLTASTTAASTETTFTEVTSSTEEPTEKTPLTDSLAQKLTTTDSVNPEDTDLQAELDDVPDKLKATFAEAIKATETKTVEPDFEMSLLTPNGLLMLDDLTPYQVKDLPNLIYQMHIFSSDVSERWIRINGKTLFEGDVLQPDLTLLEIQQDLIVWRLNSTKVGQLALIDFVKNSNQ